MMHGAVTLQAPDGKRFRSTILAFNSMTLTGKDLLIAQLTTQWANWLRPTQVCSRLLRHAERGRKAHLRRGPVSSDVILHEGVDLTKETLIWRGTSKLEIWIEFFESPDQPSERGSWSRRRSKFARRDGRSRMSWKRI